MNTDDAVGLSVEPPSLRLEGHPRGRFTQGLRQRNNDIETERQALLSALGDLDQQEGQQPGEKVVADLIEHVRDLGGGNG